MSVSLTKLLLAVLEHLQPDWTNHTISLADRPDTVQAENTHPTGPSKLSPNVRIVQQFSKSIHTWSGFGAAWTHPTRCNRSDPPNLHPKLNRTLARLPFSPSSPTLLASSAILNLALPPPRTSSGPSQALRVCHRKIRHTARMSTMPQVHFTPL